MEDRAERGWSDVAPRLHSFMIERQKETFRRQGPGWAKYRPKYRRYKQSLKDRGVVSIMDLLRWKRGRERLYPSLTQRSHRKHIWRVEAHKVEFGTRYRIARRLEQGGVNQFGERYPGRQLIVISKANQERLANLLAAYVVGSNTYNQWET